MEFFEKVTEVLKPVGKEAAKAVKNMAISILRKKNAKFRFCPKCGKEIKEKKGKFCPNCGALLEVAENIKRAGRDTNQKKKEKLQMPQKPERILIASAVCVAVIVSAVTVRNFYPGKSHVASVAGMKAGEKEVLKPHFNKSILPDSFSKKQKQELKKIYESAYEDEASALDEYIVARAKSVDEDGSKNSEFDEVLNTTENLYQMINQWDPNLKNVLAEEAGYQMGDSPLQEYAIESGVGALLGDDELGQTLRSVAVAAGYSFIKMVEDWSSAQDETTMVADSMLPVQVNEKYILSRTYGNIGQMFDEIELKEGYTIVKKILDERLEALRTQSPLVDDLTEMDSYDTWIMAEKCSARTEAINQKKTERYQRLYQAKSRLLEAIGIQNVTAVLGNMEQDEKSADMDEDWNTDEEEDTDLNDQLGNITEQYIYELSDDKGKVYSMFSMPTVNVGSALNEKGMYSLTIGTLEDECEYHVVLDKDGRILFKSQEQTEEQEKCIYYDITPSGNVLRKTFHSDFEHGDYQVLEWVKPDGTSKKLLEGGYITLYTDENGYLTDRYWKLGEEQSYYSDYYGYTCGYTNGDSQQTSGIIDINRGKLITDDEYNEIIASQNNADTSEGIRLNEKYVLTENKIVDNSGNTVKKVDNGRGVKDIRYTNGEYWIVTNSDWYYILDDKFSQVLAPVKMPVNSDYRILEEGLFIENASKDGDDDLRPDYAGSCSLYNDKGEVALDIKDVYISDLNGYICGNENVGWTNLRTGEQMFLSLTDGITVQQWDTEA